MNCMLMPNCSTMRWLGWVDRRSSGMVCSGTRAEWLVAAKKLAGSPPPLEQPCSIARSRGAPQVELSFDPVAHRVSQEPNAASLSTAAKYSRPSPARPWELPGTCCAVR